MSAELLQEVAPLHTVTATETSPTFVVLPADQLSHNIRVQYWNALLASGSGSWSFAASISYDRGATWTSKATGATITLSTTGQNAEQMLQVTQNALADTGALNNTGQIWLRVLATLGGSPTGSTMAYRADLVN